MFQPNELKSSAIPSDVSKIINTPGLTSTMGGREYLTQSLDPFHDVPYQLVGVPDMQKGNSVLYRVERSFSVSKPPLLPAGETYDAHINFMPAIFQTDNINSGCKRAIVGITPGTTGFSTHLCEDGNPLLKVGALTCNTVASNFIGTYHNGTGDTVQRYQNIDLSDLSADGPFRVVSAAFEVCNTTPDLYKSGSVTTYRQDDQWTPQSITPITGTLAVLNQNQPAFTSVGPPLTLGQAKQLESHTWDAADGCLVPILVRPYEAQRMSNQTVIIPGWFHAGLLNSLENSFSNRAIIATSGTILGTQALSMTGVHLIDCMNSGAYFAQLNENTSLLVTLRLVIEKFPDPQSSLVALAQPSPIFDPEALETLSKVFRGLPIAVKLGENAAGDWFRRVLGTIRGVANSRPFQAALAAAKLSPNPIGGIATAVDAAIAFDRALQEKRKNKAASKEKKPAPRSKMPRSSTMVGPKSLSERF